MCVFAIKIFPHVIVLRKYGILTTHFLKKLDFVLLFAVPFYCAFPELQVNPYTTFYKTWDHLF